MGKKMLVMHGVPVIRKGEFHGAAFAIEVENES